MLPIVLFGGHLLLERFGGLFGFGLAGLEQGAPDRVDALDRVEIDLGDNVHRQAEQLGVMGHLAPVRALL